MSMLLSEETLEGLEPGSCGVNIFDFGHCTLFFFFFAVIPQMWLTVVTKLQQRFLVTIKFVSKMTLMN